MGKNKFDKFRVMAVSAWDAIGDKTVNASLGMAMKQLTKSLQEQYSVEEEQIQDFSNTLSALASYLITQKVHKQKIESSAVADILSNGLVPSVVSIVKCNPKGDEIVTVISSYISDFSNNSAVKTILNKFAGDEITEHLQNAANAILAINDGTASKYVLNPEGDEQVEVTCDKSEYEEEETDIPVVKEEMTDEEDEQFVNDVFNSIPMDFSTPQAIAENFDKFVRVAGEVAKFAELQETKRTQIRADAEVAIRKVEAMRDVLQNYLEKSFDERSAIFKKQFEVVDKALTTGDNTMLSMGLTAINELAASSPFKALADINAVQQMLTSGDEEFDL